MKNQILLSSILLTQVLTSSVGASELNLKKRYLPIKPGQKVPAHVRYFTKKGKPFLQVKRNKFIKLLPKSTMSKPLTRQEKLNALSGQFYKLVPNFVVSHRSKHTEIKNQGGRGTCVAHASLASLERFHSKFMNLSEQYAYKMYETRSGENCNSEGLKTTNSAKYLKNNGIPLEAAWSYNGTRWTDDNFPDLSACQRNVHADPDQNLPPSISSASLRYKIGSYQIIGDNNNSSSNANRKTIDNVKYLKSIIGAGYDIVAGLFVTGPDWGNDGITEDTEIVDATPGVDGCTVGSTCSGGHALVLVGYNELGKYFIAKNSWGDGYKDDGYMKISYNYMNQYGKYGYYIKSAVNHLPGFFKKTLFKNKTKVVRNIAPVKKGTRYKSPKLVVDKKGTISISIKRKQAFPVGYGSMALMIFKDGKLHRVARKDSNAKNFSVSFNVNSTDKFGKYHYEVVKFQSPLPEKATTTFTVPSKNL